MRVSFLVVGIFGWNLSYFFASFSGIVAGMVIGDTAGNTAAAIAKGFATFQFF
jgi:hypothetical protein